GHGVEHLDQRAEGGVDGPPPGHGDAEHCTEGDGERKTGTGSPQRRGAVGDELAALQHLHPGQRDLAQWRQGQRRDEAETRRELPGSGQQNQWQIAEEGAHSETRASCALMASSRTRPQISSTASMKALDLATAGSLLSRAMSTM